MDTSEWNGKNVEKAIFEKMYYYILWKNINSVFYWIHNIQVETFFLILTPVVKIAW